RIYPQLCASSCPGQRKHKYERVGGIGGRQIPALDRSGRRLRLALWIAWSHPVRRARMHELELIPIEREPARANVWATSFGFSRQVHPICAIANRPGTSD